MYVPDDGEHVDEDEGKDGCEDDGATVARHGAHHVEERVLAIDDIKEEDREEEGMRDETQEAEDEVDHVVEQLCVHHRLPHAPAKHSRIAHDAHQVNAFQAKRQGTEEDECRLWTHRDDQARYHAHNERAYRGRFG